MSADIRLYHTDTRGLRTVHTSTRHLLNICARIRRQLQIQRNEELESTVDVAMADNFTDLIGLKLAGVDVGGLQVVLKAVAQMIEAGGDLEWIEILRNDEIFARQCAGWKTGVDEELARLKDDCLKQLIFLRSCLKEKLALLMSDRSLKPQELPCPTEPFVF